MLKDEIKKPYFLDLKKFLYSKGVRGPDSVPKPDIYPPREIVQLHCPNWFLMHPLAKNIYTWSNLTPLGRVKVVIIGQDPYHGPGQAHGRHIHQLGFTLTVTDLHGRPMLLRSTRR